MKPTFFDPTIQHSIQIFNTSSTIYISTLLSTETMDFGDWELLSDDGLLDFYEDNQQIISSGHHHRRSSNSNSKSVFQLEDYFSPNSHKIIRPPIPTQFVPVPIHFNPDDELDEEVTKLPIESSVVPIDQKALRAASVVEAGDQENAASSPVFFVKMKETDQFVDMKMDSPKSGSRGMFLPPIDAAGVYQFEDRSESDLDGGKMSSPRMEMEAADAKEAVSWEDNGGVNIWKWSLTGIGALCSFGVAAATVCIIIFGSQQHQQNHKPRFQIYTNDKRMKQVVVQATRLNEVISGARGVQVARAHISYGGYYDAV